MAAHIRSKRKKNFTANETPQINERVNPSPNANIGFVDEKTSGLNIRRSSRKPKPKKLHDEFESGGISRHKTTKGMNVKEEPPEDDDELPPTVFTTETPVFETKQCEEATPFVPAGLRRETRKSFQSYLEKLGYNTDFSKINEHKELIAEKRRRSKNSSNDRVKISTDDDKLQSQSVSTKDLLFPEEDKTTTNVRTSSRPSKPRKTFDLLYKKDTKSSGDKAADVNIESTSRNLKKNKLKTNLPSNTKNNLQKNSMSEKQSIVLPSKDSDKFSDENGAVTTRVSGRVRVPKRKFSLLEDKSQVEFKQQKVGSTVSELKEHKSKENVDSTVDNKHRSSAFAEQSNAKKGKKIIDSSDKMPFNSCPRKVKKIIDDINIKRKVGTPKSVNESEKKTGSKKGRERIEKIVESLLLAKQTDSGSTQDDTAVVDKPKGTKKRKRESSQEQKIKEGGGKKLKTDKEDHIVVKLHIPQGKNQSHKHHKHHHKHKKNKETSAKSIGNKSKDIPVKKHKKPVAVMKDENQSEKTKIKQEPQDDETHPHVKLIIKKNPTKSTRIAEVMMKNTTENDSPVVKVAEIFESSEKDDTAKETKSKSPVKKRVKVKKQETKGKSAASLLACAKMKKTGVKKKIELKKRLVMEKKFEQRKKTVMKKSHDVKPPKTTPLKKKEEEPMKSKTVSAYSLFTKNKRKALLDKEPNLDFASTSRRLAEMWRNLSLSDQEYWKAKARAMRIPINKDANDSNKGRRGSYESYNWSQLNDIPQSSSTGIEAIDMAAHLKLLGESLCSIGMCLKRQDQMEVHGSLSVLLDTALCSIAPIFCLTSQLTEMAGCPNETQAQILNNLAYIIPGL